MAKGIRRYVQFVLDRKAAKRTTDEMVDQFINAGRLIGTGFHRELKTQFDKVQAELRENLARGVIDPKEFKKRSDAAARAFNESLLKSMDEARKKGALTDREYIKLTKTLKKVGDDGGKAGSSLASTFGKVAGAIGAAFAVHKITAFTTSLFRASAEADAVWNRLSGTLETVGVDFNNVSGEIKGLARQMQDTTTVGDEDFAGVLTDLVSISRDYEKSLQNVSVVADLAAAKHISLETASKLVGKAMIGETSTLKRYGIIVKEGSDAVEVMRKQFEGMAANEAKTLSGQVKQLRNEWGDFKEALGGALATAGGGGSILEILTDRVQSMAGWVETNSGKIAEMGERLFDTLGNAFKLAEFIAKPFVFTYRVIADRETLAEKWDLFGKRKRNANLTTRDDAAWVADEVAKGGLRNVITGERVPPKSNAPPPPRPRTAPPQKSTRTTPAKPEQLPDRTFGGVVGDDIVGAEKVTGLLDLEENESRAQEFLSPWEKALGVIATEVEAQNGLFAQLGNAWAQGGLKGLAQFAMGKVKENVAAAIEMGAKALAYLAGGNAPSAAAAAKSAGGHVAAAGAWRLAAAAMGGSGGGGGASTTASAMGGVSNIGGTAALNTEPKSETHLYVSGFDPKNGHHIRLLGQGNRELSRTDSQFFVHSWDGKKPT